MTSKTAFKLLMGTCILLWGCDTKTKSVDSCGDHFLDPGEVCDGSQMTVNTCVQLGYYEQTDTLTCRSDCTFNLAVCTGGRCGDSIIQGVHREDCDGENLAETTCQNLGLGGGTLRCKASCRWDTAGCEVTAECGDGTVAVPFEKCEATELLEQTCETLGYYGGQLACAEDCRALDVTDCVEFGRCGDEMIQEDHGEVCEAGDLQGATCESLGNYGGTLSCGADCRSFDQSGCLGRCGDDAINGEEECDGLAPGEETCEGLGFYPGTLRCSSGCLLSTSECGGRCGDGFIQPVFGEDCDGVTLGGQTCVTRGFSSRGGALSCSTDCMFDEGACLPMSTNADLSSLTISDGALVPVFSPVTTSYTVTVPLSVESLGVMGVADDTPYATVAISPAPPVVLLEGANPVTVTVTAEDGTQKVYSVLVTRQAALDYESIHIGTLKFVHGGIFQRDATPTNLSAVSAFRMSQHEVTRAQWVAVTGWTDPSDVSYSTTTNSPVQQLNWNHAIAFCNKLSIKEGLTPVYEVAGVDFASLTYSQVPMSFNVYWNAVSVNWNANGYRLPTVMERMWAAMGADAANPGAVNLTGYAKAFAGSTGANLIGDYAVFGYNTSETGRTTTNRTNPVASKLANELNIYDLSGNVSEWLWDWYGTYPDGTLTDFRGPLTGTERTFRGGNYNVSGSYCSISGLSKTDPYTRNPSIGFRVVRN